MAGKPTKARVFSDYIYTDPETKVETSISTLGVSQYDVKLPNGGTDSIGVVGPRSFDDMLAFLQSPYATEKDKKEAYTFIWRGKEAMAAQKVRLLNDTVVTIPGTSKSLDLMAIPVPVACQAINAHDLNIKVLSDASAALEAENEDDDTEEMDEDAEKVARKNRAWNNARRFLIAAGKAMTMADGTLAPTVAGSSDLDTHLDIVEILSTKRGKRK